MLGINTSTAMFRLRKTCWGMLGIMTIGSIEPAISAAIPEPQAIVRSTKLAAEPSLANVLSGNTIPTSIKLKELTPEWRVMSTNGQFEIGNFQAFVGLFGGGALVRSEKCGLGVSPSGAPFQDSQESGVNFKERGFKPGAVLLLQSLIKH